MKKVILILCVVLFVFSVGTAFANAKIPIVMYRCKNCKKFFYSFAGDDLSSLEFSVPSNQRGRLFKFSNPAAEIDFCSSGVHDFEKGGTAPKKLSEIQQHAAQIVVIKNGKKLDSIKLSSWWCLNENCNDIFIIYGVNEENLLIKNLRQQPTRIINLKTGRGIPKCTNRRVAGHALFHEDKYFSPTSYEFATNFVKDTYFVSD